MSKARTARPQVAAGGAFRCKDRVPARHDPGEGAERRRIRDVVSAEYAYDEIQLIGERMRRDAERSAEIAELFEELGGGDRLESAIYETCQWRAAQRRDAYLFTRPHGSVRRRGPREPVDALRLVERLEKRHRAYYQRVIADPMRRALRKQKDHDRYVRRRANPEQRAKENARARERARRDKRKRYASWKAWYARSRAERSPAYLRFLQRERERVRRDYQDEARREKRRKATRECWRRKRDQLKQDPAAYRAFLDARNAKRTPNRAAPRWAAAE